MKVFVSSRERELEAEREVAARAIETFGLDALLFERDLVPKSVPSQEAYLRGVAESDIVLLLLWKEYSAAVVGEFEEARRTGKPVLCLIKELRPYWNEQVDPKLKMFIDTEVAPNYAYARFRELQELDTRIKSGLLGHFVWGARHSDLRSGSSEALFKAGTTLLARAQKKVCLASKTPIVLFGPRRYGDPNPLLYEKEQFDSCRNLVERATARKMEFICVYSPFYSRKEIKEHVDFKSNQDAVRQVRQQISGFYSWTRKPGSRLQLRAMQQSVQRNPLTLLLVDDHFLIWFKDPRSADKIWIQGQHAGLTNALANILETSSTVCKSVRAVLQSFAL